MSNVIQFRPATREQVFSRTCLYGVGGSGKTLTMLLMLRALAGPTGRYAVIDTERGRSKKYLGLFKTPEYPRGLQFDILTPTSFHPDSLTQAVAAAAAAGFDALGVDSGSHYWDGAEGMQEQVDKLSGNSRNTFGTGWKEMNPVERRMWDAVTGAPMHVVMTLRVKADYVIEEKENRQGRMVQTPVKVGMRPRQRDGFEYEFDIVGSLDLEHDLTVIKSDLMVIPVGAVYEKPGEEFAGWIRDFCLEGAEATGPMQYRERALSPEVDRPSLKELLDEVELMGHAKTPVLDEHENVVTLRELITRRGMAIKAAEDAAIRQAATAARAQAAQAPADDAGSAAPDEETRSAARHELDRMPDEAGQRYSRPSQREQAQQQDTAPPAQAQERSAQAQQRAQQGAAMNPRQRAERLTAAVNSLLTAGDVDQAGVRQGQADRSPLVGLDVSGLLNDRDRTSLGLMKGQAVTLGELAAMVCMFVGTNKQSVRMPLDAPLPAENAGDSQVPPAAPEGDLAAAAAAAAATRAPQTEADAA